MSFNYMQPFVTLASGLNTMQTGATEFNSMYESFNPLTTVNKQHFVEWFSGSALDSIWTRSFSGGSFGMSDSINGGFYNTVTGTQNEGIFFNNKRQYAYNGSVLIFTMYATNTGRTDVSVGLSNQADISQPLGTGHYGIIEVDTGSGSGTTLTTADGTTETVTAMSGSNMFSGSLENYKMAFLTSSIESYDKGVLKATKTTNLPSTNLQPTTMARAIFNTTGTLGMTYLEAYNT